MRIASGNRRAAQSIFLCETLRNSAVLQTQKKVRKTSKTTPKTGNPSEFPPYSRNDWAVFILWNSGMLSALPTTYHYFFQTVCPVIPTKEESLQVESTESIFIRVTLRFYKREKNSGNRVKQLQNRKLSGFTPPGLSIFRGDFLLLTCRSSGAGGVHGVQGGPGSFV